MASFPKDLFDDLPTDLTRVGAHRAPKKRGGGWIAFAWAALATGIIVAGGLYAISRIDSTFVLPGFEASASATPTATPTVVPTATPLTDPATIDPARAITITVLNGSTVAGSQTVAGDALTAAGWPIGSVTTASSTDVKKTTIYYSSPADEDIARGLVVALGIGEVTESTAFQGAPITIVLGADYPPK